MSRSRQNLLSPRTTICTAGQRWRIRVTIRSKCFVAPVASSTFAGRSSANSG
jgi:hypothetical protein